MFSKLTYLGFLAAIISVQCTNEKQSSIPRDSNTSQDIEPSNSYVSIYANSNIKYSYTENSQIHDYSNNWDFDGDGVFDRLQFWGNGATHIQYYPLVYLSSVNKVFYYEHLLIDMPMYNQMDSLGNNDIGFNIRNFDNNGTTDIILNVDYRECCSDVLKEIGIKSSKVILEYNGKGGMKLVNY